jgi:hypothetical protein
MNQQQSKIFKLLGYLVYLLYLGIAGRFNFTFVLVPLIFLLIPLRTEVRIGIILLFFLFDFDFAYTNESAYQKFNWVNLFIQQHKTAPYFLLIPLFSLSYLVWIGLFSYCLAYLRKIRSYLSLFVLCFVLIGCVFVTSKASSISTLPMFYFFGLTSLICNKIWLIYLLSVEFPYAAQRQNAIQFLGGLVAPGPAFKETNRFEHFQDLSSEGFWRGVRMSAVVVVGYLFLNQLIYQITGNYSSLVVPNQSTLGLVCPTGSRIQSTYIELFQANELWLCFFNMEILVGFVRVLFLDTMILVIPGMMMGLRYHLPFGNFFRVRSWSEFLFKLTYYYSLVIYRIFIVEFRKMMADLAKHSSSFFQYAGPFAGVFVGGIVHHIFKDQYLAYWMGAERFLLASISLAAIIYFTFLSVTIMVDEVLLRIYRRQNRTWLVLTFLPAFLIVRFIYIVYIREQGGENAILFLHRMFGF